MPKQRSTRRPSKSVCADCGKSTWLVDCGVPAHRRVRTRREQLDDRCAGRVYVHVSTGGIECENP